MERTNEMWLKQLRDDSPKQAEAIEELRQYLKRGVLLHDARLSLKRRLQLLDLEPQYILQLFGTESGTGYRRPLMAPVSSTARL